VIKRLVLEWQLSRVSYDQPHGVRSLLVLSHTARLKEAPIIVNADSLASPEPTNFSREQELRIASNFKHARALERRTGGEAT
jgi:hypothetical protein